MMRLVFWDCKLSNQIGIFRWHPEFLFLLSAAISLSCSQKTTEISPALDTLVTPAVGSSLLVNGAFQSGVDNWIPCSSSEADAIVVNSENGSLLSVRDKGCVYQEFSVRPKNEYIMTCMAKNSTDDYASISISILDSAYDSLATQTVELLKSDFQTYTAAVSSPKNGSIGVVTFYSEGQTEIDNCAVDDS